MIQASFSEQLNMLGNIFITNKYVFYIALIALGSILLLELSNKFKNKKILKIVCMSVYFIIFGLLLYFFHDTSFTLIDYLINNIFFLDLIYSKNILIPYYLNIFDLKPLDYS